MAQTVFASAGKAIQGIGGAVAGGAKDSSEGTNRTQYPGEYRAPPDFDKDPRDAIIARQAVEIEDLNRALHNAVTKLREISELAKKINSSSRMY